MIKLIKRRFHGKTIHFNNENNVDGKEYLELCIFDENAETDRGIFKYPFPLKSSQSFLFSEKTEQYKENVLLRIQRIKPLLFDVVEIRYLTFPAEKIIGSYIDKDRQKELFDDHFIFRTEYFRQGKVTMVNSIENINFVAEIIENKSGKKIKDSTFQKVLCKYMESFFINEDNHFQPNEQFNNFYNKIKFI